MDTSISHSPGTYWYGIRVFDNANHWNDEENSKTNYQPYKYEPIEVTVVDISGYSSAYIDRHDALAPKPTPSSQNYINGIDDHPLNNNKPTEEGIDHSIDTNTGYNKSQPVSQNLMDTSNKQNSRINDQQVNKRPSNAVVNDIKTGSSNVGSVSSKGQNINNAPNNENSVIDIPPTSMDNIKTGGPINIQSGTFKFKLLNMNNVESLRILDNKNTHEFDLTVLDENGSGSKRVGLWRKFEDGNWQEISGITLNGQNKTRFNDYPAVSGNYTYQLRGS
jgi:hypothetical protein